MFARDWAYACLIREPFGMVPIRNLALLGFLREIRPSCLALI